MDKLAASIGAIAISLGGVFVLVCFSTVMGAFAGLIVGLFFSDTFLSILSQMGIRNIAMWQFGAFMGFMGGFLKTKVTVTEK